MATPCFRHKCIYLTGKKVSLVPRPLPFFVLRFSYLPLLCIILNANRRTKNGGGLGTRLGCYIDAFMNCTCENFDKMQIIFKAITESSGCAPWWERKCCTLWRWLFDAGLAALESISPGEGIYYGTLRCHTLPSGERTSQGSNQLHVFYDRFFSYPYSTVQFFPTRWRDRTSGYRFVSFAYYQNSHKYNS